MCPKNTFKYVSADFYVMCVCWKTCSTEGQLVYRQHVFLITQVIQEEGTVLVIFCPIMCDIYKYIEKPEINTILSRIP